MFAVVYKFKIKPGHEDNFRDAWRRLTDAIYAKHGSRGSRLHHGDSDTWFAYAQWPSREAWESARARPSADPDAGAQMRECLAEPIETLAGEMCEDLLR